jgi:AsmA protein
VAGEADRLKMENVTLDLNGNQGAGVLDLSLSDGLPTVAGTLAFRTLDLRSFMATFMPMAASRGQMDDAVDSELASQINLDLRLSAANATAATSISPIWRPPCRSSAGLAAFDLSDATVFGGTLQAGLRIDRAGENSTAEFRVNAEQIDAGALVLSTGMRRIVPQARANLALTAKGTGPTGTPCSPMPKARSPQRWARGTIVGVDMPAFLGRASEGAFFAFSDVANGQLAISGAELKGTMQNGVLRIDHRRPGGDRIISIEGIVPYLGRALALSGEIAPKSDPENGPAAPEAVFFIGGWLGRTLRLAGPLFRRRQLNSFWPAFPNGKISFSLDW